MTDMRESLVRDRNLAGSAAHRAVRRAACDQPRHHRRPRGVTPHQPPGPPGTGPQITFARSGLTVNWSDQNRSLLELADACDVPTRWSCRTGVCHTCVTPILSGEVAYAPDPLEMPGRDEALICCSQPRGDVVLDL